MNNRYQQQIDDLLQRNMSRAEFMKYIGIALLGIIGVTGFLKNLHEAVPQRPAPLAGKSGSGYGRNSYGR